MKVDIVFEQDIIIEPIVCLKYKESSFFVASNSGQQVCLQRVTMVPIIGSNYG